MLALAYDAALRRGELCSLRTDDFDPAHRTLRIRAETTKNGLERVVLLRMLARYDMFDGTPDVPSQPSCRLSPAERRVVETRTPLLRLTHHVVSGDVA